MLSNIITEHLENAGLDLVRAQNLFSEEGNGSQYVVVKTTTAENVSLDSPGTLARVQVLLKGFTYDDGFVLASKISDEIEGMIGTYTKTGIDWTEAYYIFSVSAYNKPVSFRQTNDLYCSVNFGIGYQVTVS